MAGVRNKNSKIALRYAHLEIGTRIGLLPGKAGELGLTLPEKRFCELYTTQSDFFGNGTQSYIAVYGKGKKGFKKKYANNQAHALLAKPYILKYINHCLEEQELTDKSVDTELSFLVKQRQNLYVKLGGISEYNKLKKRVGSMDPGGNKTLIIVVSPQTAERYNLTPTEIKTP